MNELTIKEPMKLTAANVHAVIKDCLNDTDGEMCKAVLVSARLDSKRLEAHREQILSMLSQLPEQFMRSCGGGWSFLNACVDADGRQWYDAHRTIDILVLLGIAIGAVEFVFTQRELWRVLPGGMPYFVINDDLFQ